jgi:hypothetical protein
MKSFRNIVVLKRPQQELWTIMRDHLVAFSGSLADIAEVREVARTVDTDAVHIVNEWHARQQIPSAIRSILKTDELSWIDRNTWDARTHTCRWTIEPKFLAQHIACSGHTVFTTAMAGQGTRVTFEGELDLKPGMLGSSLGGMERLLSGFIESIVTTVIPRNLRSVVEAAATFELPPVGPGR